MASGGTAVKMWPQNLNNMEMMMKNSRGQILGIHCKIYTSTHNHERSYISVILSNQNDTNKLGYTL